MSGEPTEPTHAAVTTKKHAVSPRPHSIQSQAEGESKVSGPPKRPQNRWGRQPYIVALPVYRDCIARQSG